MEEKKRTEIAEIGRYALIDRLASGFSAADGTTIAGIGDDAAVIDAGDGTASVVATETMLEGIDFDLTYFPMKHLGYKAVTVGMTGVLAMNAVPGQVALSLGVSSKLSVEALDDFMAGVEFACRESGVDLAGLDVRASMTGFVIAVTAIGRVACGNVVRRSGAGLNDLICITGNLGAAYMGLHLLEREKRVLGDIENPEPKFEGHEYLLERYLKPRARKDIVESLAEEGIVPTAMTDLSDGLAGDLMRMCRASKCGARIYLDRIPIARQTTAMAEELHADPVVAALNGGEDRELLFTVPLEMQEKVMRMGGVDVIGHVTAENTGTCLVTPDGSEIALKAQGFRE